VVEVEKEAGEEKVVEMLILVVAAATETEVGTGIGNAAGDGRGANGRGDEKNCPNGSKGMCIS